MPASERRVFQDFKVSARPAWRWRRWTRFPLYFQAFKPRFQLHVKKISNGAGREPNVLKFYIAFADGTRFDFPFDVSGMSVGEHRVDETRGILLSPSGDARICLDTGPTYGPQAFLTLYAFVVSAEATLVFLLLNVVFGATIALLLRL